MGFKELVRGIASVPGKINEARYKHQTVYAPIARDPDTGEEVEIPAEQLAKGMYDPRTGQILMPETRRTGESGFGKFVRQGAPALLRGALAGAAAPSIPGANFGTTMIQSMDISQKRAQDNDMLAYQIARQRMQDRWQMENHQAQSLLHTIQAKKLLEKKDPIEERHDLAIEAGLNPVSDEYKYFMATGKLYDPWKNVGGSLVNEKTKEVIGPKLGATAQAEERLKYGRDVLKLTGPALQHYAIEGKDLRTTTTAARLPSIEYQQDANGNKKAYRRYMGADGQEVVTPAPEFDKAGKAKGAKAEKEPARITPHDAIQITKDKDEATQKAIDAYKAVKTSSNPDPVKVEQARVQAVAALKRIQKNFEALVQAGGGSISPGGSAWIDENFGPPAGAGPQKPPQEEWEPYRRGH